MYLLLPSVVRMYGTHVVAPKFLATRPVRWTYSPTGIRWHGASDLQRKDATVTTVPDCGQADSNTVTKEEFDQGCLRCHLMKQRQLIG